MFLGLVVWVIKVLSNNEMFWYELRMTRNKDSVPIKPNNVRSIEQFSRIQQEGGAHTDKAGQEQHPLEICMHAHI